MKQRGKKKKKPDVRVDSLEKCSRELNALDSKFRADEETGLNVPHRFNMLLEITKGINTILNLDDLLVSVVDAAIDLVNATRGFLMLSSEDGGLEIVVARDRLGDDIRKEEFKVSNSVINDVIRNRQPLFVDNIKKDERFSKKSSVVELKLYSAICVPLITTRARNIQVLIGILYVDSSSVTTPLSREDIDLLLAFAGQVAISIENVRLYELSIEDSLTKVYNRDYLERRLEEELNRAERYNHDLSVLMVDVDNLKLVNDRFGHQMGDKILKEIALHLKRRMRGCDILARYGGDEFVVVLPETSKENAQVFAEDLREIVSRKMRVADFSLTVSIGIASYPSDVIEKHPELKVALLQKSDQALYQAKSLGRNRVSHFNLLEEKNYIRSDNFLHREIQGLKREEVYKLLEVTANINTIMKLDEVMKAIVKYAIELVRAEKARLVLFDELGRPDVEMARDRQDTEVSEDQMKISDTFISNVKENGLPLLVGDVRHDALFKEKAELIENVQSVLCVPIFVGGKIIGILFAEGDDPSAAFTKSDLRLLMSFANLSAPALERALEIR